MFALSRSPRFLYTIWSFVRNVADTDGRKKRRGNFFFFQSTVFWLVHGGWYWGETNYDTFSKILICIPPLFWGLYSLTRPFFTFLLAQCGWSNGFTKSEKTFSNIEIHCFLIHSWRLMCERKRREFSSRSWHILEDIFCWLVSGRFVKAVPWNLWFLHV